MKEIAENNRIHIVGEIKSKFCFSHEVFGKGFYMADVAVKRISDQYDILPILVSERLMDVKSDCIDSCVEVLGHFRSYNRHETLKSRLILSVYAKEIHMVEQSTDYNQTNHIFLDGYICKQPIYRKTPLGREITDIVLAVNRPYGKTDYIPCISWGRNARFASGFKVGTRIRTWGRVQSRGYTKKLNDAEYEDRIAYEVSISKIEVVK